MTDDYRAKSRSDQEVRRVAKKLRIYFGVADCRYVDILDCLQRKTILTVKGERQLKFEICPDDEMGGDYGRTSYGKDIVAIAVRQSVRNDALIGIGRARNTLAHELGHGVMHDGVPMARRTIGNVTPMWLRPFESAEHQAKVFAPAFLINDSIAQTLGDAEEIAIEIGISLESAKIYYDELIESHERSKNAERMLRLANEFRASMTSPASTIRYLEELWPVCGRQTVIPIGVKFMCHTCGDVRDRFPDGDSAR
jgi:hypothetical protein